jgi:hypothetical protein
MADEQPPLWIATSTTLAPRSSFCATAAMRAVDSSSPRPRGRRRGDMWERGYVGYLDSILHGRRGEDGEWWAQIRSARGHGKERPVMWAMRWKPRGRAGAGRRTTLGDEVLAPAGSRGFTNARPVA